MIYIALYELNVLISLFDVVHFLDGPSAGLVVGILLAVIVIIVAVVLIGFFMYKRNEKDKAALADLNLGGTSFANVLYESKSEALGVEMVTKPQTETEPGTQA